MAWARFGARRQNSPRPANWEPTPYCDRLTLAEAFSEDRESRATAEDLRVDHTLADTFVDVLAEAVGSAHPASSRRKRARTQGPQPQRSSGTHS